MIFKNSEIILKLNAMDCLAEIPFPVKLAYAIKKNHKKLMAEYDDYIEFFNGINKEYQDETGEIPKDKKEEHGKKIGELLSIESEIDMHMISEDIFDSSDFDITLQQLSALDFMIK